MQTLQAPFDVSKANQKGFSKHRHSIIAMATTILAILLPINAIADDSVQTVDSGASQKILEKKLKNGLTVIVIPSPKVPIVTIEIAVKNGAFTETPKLSGLSHLFEHMFFKSNAVIPNQEAYMKRMRELGISFNGTTSVERVNYFFTLPKSNFVPGLKFMYDAITTVKFDKTEFQKEKEVVVGEIDRAEANPYYWFHLDLENRLFFKYPNRRNPLGTRESVRAATTKMMETMKKTYYVPNNSALLISGDVDPEEAFNAVEKQFSSWKKARDPFRHGFGFTHPALKEDVYFILNKEVNVPSFQFYIQGPTVHDDEKATYAMDVLQSVVSQTESSFQKALVDSQLAYTANISYQTVSHGGPISIGLAAAPNKILDAISATVSELQKMEDPAYFTPESIANAKTSITTNTIYEQEEPSSYIHSVSFWWAYSSLDYLNNYMKGINSVSAQDLSDVVKKYINNKHFVAGLLTSEPMTKQFGVTEETIKKAVEAGKNHATKGAK